jgi:hypothetical protein
MGGVWRMRSLVHERVRACVRASTCGGARNVEGQHTASACVRVCGYFRRQGRAVSGARISEGGDARGLFVTGSGCWGGCPRAAGAAGGGCGRARDA